jgi:hypothetical protein
MVAHLPAVHHRAHIGGSGFARRGDLSVTHRGQGHPCEQDHLVFPRFCAFRHAWVVNFAALRFFHRMRHNQPIGTRLRVKQNILFQQGQRLAILP